MLQLTNQLRRFAEGVLVVMMGIMFATVIAQVIFRYVLNLPLAWSDEICNFIWLWGILWGASFVMRNHEDIRFDMLYNLLSRKSKRILTFVASSSLVLVLLLSLPKTWSFIDFMKIEKSAAMGIPMNWVFGLYLVFIVTMCIRHIGIAFDAIKDKLSEDGHSLIDSDLLHLKDKA
ncbi:MAG TPA: TRAP transporter small permease [Burkholderiaceae bacterium]|nr:TRAP transporter small permease [Burkholderiaceae bacterium]